MIFTNRRPVKHETQRQREYRLSSWHPHFCWRRVQVSIYQVAWLRWVERKISHYDGSREYRL